MGSLSKALLAVLALSFLTPAFARYDGPPILGVDGKDLGPWFSSLWSDYGRCCEEADATLDVYWQSSKTATSGYAIIVNGQVLDVSKEAANIFTYSSDPYAAPNGNFIRIPVTDNKARVAIAWIEAWLDENGDMKYAVRCLLPGAAN